MKKPVSLLPAKWDFAKVADDEALFCVYYEYGREAEAFRKRVGVWRKNNSKLFSAACNLVSRIPVHQSTKKDEGFKKAWKIFLDLSYQGASEACYPDGLSQTDHRTTLYSFPDFPEKPWQEIDQQIRRAAPFFLNPNLYLKILQSPSSIQKPSIADTLIAQREIQSRAGCPMSDQQLAQAVRHQVNEHVFSPAIVEQPDFGMVPASVIFRKGDKQAWVEGFCRERVSFVINWAWGDDEILASLRKWLRAEGRRPHKKFEHWKMTSPHEHLNNLGAFRILRSGVTADQAAEHYTLYENPEQYLRAKRAAALLCQQLFPPDNT